MQNDISFITGAKMINLDFIPFPDLATDRLFLRQIKREDANEIFALRSDDQVNQYLDRTKAKTIEDARQHIERLNEGMLNKDGITWVITLKANDQLIGTICFWKISKEQLKAEIGYELLPAYQGKGIMQEVMAVVIKYGFEHIKFHSIEAELSPANLKSVKLLERNNFIPDVSRKNTDPVVYILTNKGS